jgi:hypothetical protein
MWLRLVEPQASMHFNRSATGIVMASSAMSKGVPTSEPSALVPLSPQI